MVNPVPAADIRVVTAARFAAVAGELIAQELSSALGERDVASLVLAGGSTPAAAYRHLAGARLDWSRVHLYFGDERCVPHDHADSNARMVNESLIVPAGIPDESVFTLPEPTFANQAAARYAATIRRTVAGTPPRFDLVLLGMGEDGHTASLFPGDPVLDETKALTAVVHGPKPPPTRVTLTLPLLNAARTTLFLVKGESKASALERVWRGDRSLPAARIQPNAMDPLSRVIWLVDEAAAGRGADA